MRKLILLLGTGAVLLFSACHYIDVLTTDTENAIAYDLGEVFTLDFGESMACANCEAPSILFEELVEDSRCPLGYECVWAGQVIVQLKAGETSFDLGLSPLESVAAKDTIDAMWTVELLSVSPHPVSEEDWPSAEDYTLELIVEEL